MVDLPLWEIDLPWPCSNEEYESLMATVCRRAVGEGFSAMAFGDLFLRDIREYREKQLAGSGLEAIFPVWNFPTSELAQEMIASGVRAKLTCVDPRKLDPAFAGRDFDTTLLQDLPQRVDTCGENGEFHTFVYAAPVFREPIAVECGSIVERDGFVFVDVTNAD
jgi:diphthamide synthase (EF-2-diphthine--ammonia ligase)